MFNALVSSVQVHLRFCAHGFHPGAQSMFLSLSVCACVRAWIFHVHYSTFYSFYVYQISNAVCFLLFALRRNKKNRNEINVARRDEPMDRPRDSAHNLTELR